MPDNFLNSARVAELWAAIKTALAGKADLSALDGYTTPDAVATAITSALTNYATNAGVQTAIATALANYMTGTEVDAAIAKAVADAAHITVQTVDTLPATGTANVIYLVPNGGSGQNSKDEYVDCREVGENRQHRRGPVRLLGEIGPHSHDRRRASGHFGVSHGEVS